MGRFYARRALRIFPIYYLIVLGAVLIDLPPARQLWPWLVTYSSNFYVTLHLQSVGYFASSSRCPPGIFSSDRSTV